MSVETNPTGLETAPARFALSIVIPIYNGSSSIAEVIAGLEELSIVGGYEIVLVNDGSPDNSLEVCRALVPATYPTPAERPGQADSDGRRPRNRGTFDRRRLRNRARQ
jgi:glycosyltransferase involved in cell wall biosynthesis